MGSRPAMSARPVILVRGNPRGGPRRWLPHALAITLFALVLVLGALLIAQRGHVYPGVAAASVPLGGLSQDAARAKVSVAAANLQKQPITLVAAGKQWTAMPAELGIAYDANMTVNEAMGIGRGDDTGAGLLRLLRLGGDRTVPLAVTIDTKTFNAYLDTIDATLPGRAEPPVVTITGTTAAVVPGRDGQAIDREAALKTIREEAGGVQSGPVTLPVHLAHAAGSVEQANAAKATIDRALAAPMTLTGAGNGLSLTPTQLGGIVRVKPVAQNGETTLAVTLDDAGLAKLVGEIAKSVDVPVADAYVQDYGTHKVLMPSVQGVSVAQDKLAANIRAAFVAGQHTVTVPTVTTKPKVTTEDQMATLGITNVVAKGTSDFSGSGPARAHNVELAAYLVDGTLIAPGATFSYNDALGSILSKDFEEAGSYIDGLNGTSIGGGVCQVSTTIFRAALKGGLPITEWYPHSYRSKYYEQGGWAAGFDASITQDGNDPSQSSDFKFVNPTNGWMLLRVSVGPNMTLTATLYGVPTGYTVAIDNPVTQVTTPASDTVAQEVDSSLPAGTVIEDQPAMAGTEVTVVRHVYDANGNVVSTDTFVSDYGPTGAVDRVSPDMAGQ